MTSSSLERNETGAVGGTNTGPSVLDRLVSDGKLAQVVTDHFRLKKKKEVEQDVR
jgi:hypothetical protein